jgi:hypothetical protein
MKLSSSLLFFSPSSSAAARVLMLLFFACLRIGEKYMKNFGESKKSRKGFLSSREIFCVLIL